ncbi:MAG: HlyD family efflux transporter periplasmic adaptor subunit [Rhodospirillales bacterium]|nr:HlyD family efflux transporter periplasmic adaptor subunit [Rhodospirillales bacterium]
MKPKWRRIVMWGVMALMLAGGIVFAFQPQPLPVDLGTVARGPLMVTVNEDGETRVRDVYTLSAPTAGRVLRINSEAGDLVTAGETVLAEIEPIDPAFLDVRSEAQARAAVQTAEAARALAAAELEKAEAELDFAKGEQDRVRMLFEREIVSRRAFDDAERLYRTRKAAVGTARAGLQMREFELDQARVQLLSPTEARERHGPCDCVPIRAPVSGRILRLFRESEGVVQAGSPLLEIGNPADLEVKAELLSADAVKVRPGMRVLIDEWGGEGVLNGRVRRVEPYGFTKISALGIEEQRVNVVIDFTDPPENWSALGHGYRVGVRVALWEGGNVLKVPLIALFRSEKGWAVFARDDEGAARVRQVELGRRNGLEAEILSGLDEGVSIVLNPGDRIADGVLVQSRD